MRVTGRQLRQIIRESIEEKESNVILRMASGIDSLYKKAVSQAMSDPQISQLIEQIKDPGAALTDEDAWEDYKSLYFDTEAEIIGLSDFAAMRAMVAFCKRIEKLYYEQTALKEMIPRHLFRPISEDGWRKLIVRFMLEQLTPGLFNEQADKSLSEKIIKHMQDSHLVQVSAKSHADAGTVHPHAYKLQTLGLEDEDEV